MMGRVMKEWVHLDPGVVADAARAADLVDLARHYVAGLPAKTPAPRKTKRQSA